MPAEVCLLRQQLLGGMTGRDCRDSGDILYILMMLSVDHEVCCLLICFGRWAIGAAVDVGSAVAHRGCSSCGSAAFAHVAGGAMSFLWYVSVALNLVAIRAQLIV